MRLGVLDIGSNTVHLLVVDAHPRRAPRCRPSRTRPSCACPSSLQADGRLERRRRPTALVEASSASASTSPRTRASRTSSPSRPRPCATRPNGDDVLARSRDETGVDLAGAARRGRGPADVPGRAALVRLVAPAGCSSSTSAAGRSSSPAGIDEEPDVALRCRSAPAGSPATGCPPTRRREATSRACASTCAPSCAERSPAR